MCEGCGSRSVCLSVAKLTVAYLVYTLKTRCRYGIFMICIVWILLKIFCSKVLVAFATTTTFFASRGALDGQKRQRSLHFKKTVCIPYLFEY